MTVPTARRTEPPTLVKPLNTDRPIESSDEDKLERAGSAQVFADGVLELDSSKGLVVGVLGPWGSGKTSYINLARETFKASGAHLVDFNPWMFSGVDRLIEAFFSEVSAELKLLPQLNEAGKELEEYGELLSGFGWVPIIGPWAERARIVIRLVGGGLKKTKGGTNARRKQVERALAKLDKPVVINLDDIDRLTTQEIRQVFQLVRLTANFPNVIYVLAFDRNRVEQALTEEGVPGRAYLEKILQLAIDLPMISGEVLQSQIFETLNTALANVENSQEIDPNVWPSVFFEIVRPLLRSMRDVSRYGLAVRTTVTSLQGQVALADVLALEAVRVFLPDFFAAIPTAIDALTTVSDGSFGRSGGDQQKAEIEALIRRAGDQAEIARSVLKLLFPASRRHIDNYYFSYDSKAQWLRERRVGHESILRLYLERVQSPPLKAHLAAEKAFAVLGDGPALSNFLRSLSSEIIEDVISGLEVFEDKYTPEQVVPGVTSLLNFMPSIPERQRGMLDFGTRMKVTRVTYRLLRSLGDPTKIEDAVREILPHLNHLSLKWEVISDVGYRENSGHRLVNEEAARSFETAWREEVQRATVEQLEADPDLLSVFLEAKRNLGEGESAPSIPSSTAITHRLLKNARSDMLSQSMGSYTVHREPRLDWNALVSVFGSESEVLDRIDHLLGSATSIEDEFRALVQKYRDGWRPDNR
jgi:predicted KAP-like P-loop ATPase